MIGGAIGRAAANALELEYAGMDPGQADIEKARRIVRVLRSAIRELSADAGPAPPEVRRALGIGVGGPAQHSRRQSFRNQASCANGDEHPLRHLRRQVDAAAGGAAATRS